MSEDVHVRFCERLEGRFLGATRRNVYVRSHRAGQRVLAGLRKQFARLRLKINESKTAVASAFGRTFLGFSLLGGPWRRRETRDSQQSLGDLQAADTVADAP